jgi:hypothetical protein
VLSQEGASAALVTSTVRAAADQAVAAPVAAILKGVLRAMLLHKLKKVVGFLLLLGLLAAGTSLVLSASQPGTEAPEGGGPARTPKEAVAAATAEEVGSAFLENDAYADEHFIHKKVRVSGYVGQVKGAGQPSTSYLVLVFGKKSGRSPMPLGFTFSPEARKQLAPLKPSQKVVIEGTCLGLVNGEPVFPGVRQLVQFERCVLVRVDPLPPPGMSGPRGGSHFGGLERPKGQ